MNFIVNKEVCIGCGFCVRSYSKIFEMDRDGLAIVIEKYIDEEYINKANYIIKECPVLAIKK